MFAFALIGKCALRRSLRETPGHKSHSTTRLKKRHLKSTCIHLAKNVEQFDLFACGARFADQRTNGTGSIAIRTGGIVAHQNAVVLVELMQLVTLAVCQFVQFLECVGRYFAGADIVPGWLDQRFTAI